MHRNSPGSTSQSDHGRVEQALSDSLAKLHVEYVDLYLMHWPMAYDDSGLYDVYRADLKLPLTNVMRLPDRQHLAAKREPDVCRDVA